MTVASDIMRIRQAEAVRINQLQAKLDAELAEAKRRLARDAQACINAVTTGERMPDNTITRTAYPNL